MVNLSAQQPIFTELMAGFHELNIVRYYYFICNNVNRKYVAVQAILCHDRDVFLLNSAWF